MPDGQSQPPFLPQGRGDRGDADVDQAPFEAAMDHASTAEADIDDLSSGFVHGGCRSGDGFFMVGRDIDPGRYKAGASLSGSCCYARLSGMGGGIDDIIDNNNVPARSPST